MENLNEIVFYSLDKAIRSYRQFAHQQLSAHGFDVTVDQWLVLRSIGENPDYSQHQIAEMTFKDYASLTRIIELLVKKKYLERTMHQHDRRRFNLTLTDSAHQVLKAMQPVIENNRKHALMDISHSDIQQLQKTLSQIIKNCGIT
ncbi:MarR family winged helix-turn-helix transcriptional regulator [Mucilaginibacter segetis]|uniref:MarR family transcriptional regulator n=1 Tax=Mucilaginibacter segetis TaxID=2793071 RepID=A0A934PWV2_9SPHI|nr:MarR family transcriptional regulator [Mucilaginibacter segetis]MBK0380630.1 MarR family transcriptional regulator [Mucilaginibacter segetis]